MASPFLPSTPKAASAPTPTSDNRTPGTWRHPHLNEIVRRQNAGTLGDRNIKKAVGNFATLVATWILGNILRSIFISYIGEYATYYDHLLLFLKLIFVLNILIALYPAYRPKDDLSDIPLTPTQRSLLGLDPTATPSGTPGTTYVTPPKYRASASRTTSSGSKGASPLSASASASGQRLSGGASFSPSSSPLFHKAVSNGGRDSGRRPSFGSSSPFGRSSFRESSLRESSFGESSFRESSIGPATPSPSNGKRVNLGLSNKWLYERSRRLSASNGSL